MCVGCTRCTPGCLCPSIVAVCEVSENLCATVWVRVRWRLQCAHTVDSYYEAYEAYESYNALTRSTRTMYYEAYEAYCVTQYESREHLHLWAMVDV